MERNRVDLPPEIRNANELLHDRRLVTLDEAASQLRKTPGGLRWMVHAGTAPKSGLIGGRRMFRQVDIDAFIEQAFEESQ